MPARDTARCHDFSRLLDPRGIAVVGASADSSRPGGQAVRALRENGYAGGIHPVNPRYQEIDGLPCVPDLAAIEGPCDIAVIALPAAQVPGIVGECGVKGIPFAVALAGGFRETGEAGTQREQELIAAARAGGVRVLGPNCLGLVNVHTRAYAAWGSLTRPPRLAPGPVSAVVQSASFGMSMVIQCAAAGLGFRFLVTSGNEADISAPELIGACVDDPGTQVILAYLEGLADGRAFLHAAGRALAAGKPLVVIKAGNTEQGRRAAESHTANMTGDYDVYRAAFRQCGAIEVGDVHEAVDTILCLSSGRLPAGRRVAVMGGSGGAAAMFSDQADRVGLTLPAFAPATMATLKATLPPLASLRNPVDYTAGYPRAAEGLDFARAFGAALADPNVDQLAVLLAAAGRNQVKYAGEVLARVAAASTRPIVVYSGMNDTLAPEGLERLREAGIPVIASPGRAAAAMARLADYAAARTRAAQPEEAAVNFAFDLPAGPAVLDEVRSKELIAAAGIPVTRDRLLPLDPAPDAVADLPWPVALKIVSPDLPHKSDLGGVRLNVPDARALAAAAAEIVARARAAAPAARLEGLLAAEMIGDGVEAIVGVVNDPAFGPVVALGLGGIYTEVLRDLSYRVAPFGIDEARAMIGELRGGAIFAGLRGRPRADTAALAEALVCVSRLAWSLRERLAELDINPLLVRPDGRGVCAADALVVLR